MSNNSPRNCKLNLSDTFVFLMTEKSALTKSGPVTALRLRLPGWQVVLTQGDANSVANTALVPNHAEGSPVTASLGLNDGADLPSSHEAVRRERQLVKPAKNETTTNVELRRTVIPAGVIRVLKDVRLARGKGIVVQRLGVGV